MWGPRLKERVPGSHETSIRACSSQLKDATEGADQEWALKDIVMAMAKDKERAAENAEKKARDAEKARALAEQGLAEAGKKLGEIKLKLVETESLSQAQATEIV